MLSYQHGFHAGNRADVLKHAVQTDLLQGLRKTPGPIFYVETHSGRGAYDFASEQAKKLQEHKLGVEALLSGKPPKALKPYADFIRGIRKSETGKFYPGSPRIAGHLLGDGDRLVLFEKHPAEFEALQLAMGEDPRVQIKKTDGYSGALRLAPRSRERLVVMVDPSYETERDLEQIVEWTPRALRRWPDAVIVIWLPLFKDAREEDFGAYLADLEQGVIAGARWPVSPDGRSSLEGSAMIVYRVDEALGHRLTGIGDACRQVWSHSAPV